jgi:hypothetical protein
MRRRRYDTGIRAEVRQAAAELRRLSRALLKLERRDDPSLTADGHRLLQEVARGLGFQVDWLAEELTVALDGQRWEEPPPGPPLRRIVLTVRREQAVPWTICSGRMGRPVEQWLADLADAEIERLSELADREELSKWLLTLGDEEPSLPPEHGPEQRASFRRAAELLLTRAAQHA